ncbi:Uncharacterized protein NF27_EY00370 [Candidatus Jidaibacter acanthamoeba]|uniref:NAD-dependent epimerase/dehydratase domain-containing protein n=1 Tax=Candidatus Jidaibacter acanthamoebae TaxID=86105 RepID=A0A0C1MYF4_9RICK|nr:hypothetical protein [Candidatus Jidaibacter acanthamoeba]KIE04941.1 Uncharacterized protein NF27_EY00370 [Candidatus Jidaibacter acanthamoeba]
MKNHLFCFGLGYTALEVIRELNSLEPESWKYSGTKRNPANVPDKPIIEIIDFDDLIIIPKSVTHILLSIPPKEDGDIIYNRFLHQIKKLPNLKWIGYFSTTGVYGDYQGKWVNEQSLTKTENFRSILRLKAESQWQSLTELAAVNIFRLSAIYGVNRSEFEKILSGRAQVIIKPNQFFSRIHVNDIAQIVVKAINFLAKNEVYNLSDDYPCAQNEVTEHAYKLLNLTPPKPIAFKEAELSEMAQSFYLESKRVSNNKVKQGLGVNLRYPSYKEGLQAIFKEIHES